MNEYIAEKKIQYGTIYSNFFKKSFIRTRTREQLIDIIRQTSNTMRVILEQLLINDSPKEYVTEQYAAYLLVIKAISDSIECRAYKKPFGIT